MSFIVEKKYVAFFILSFRFVAFVLYLLFVIKVLQFDSLFFLFFDLPYNADCKCVVLCMYSRIHTT